MEEGIEGRFSRVHDTKGADICVDITITSPLVLDVYLLNIEKGATPPNNTERDKRSKQLHQCDAMGWGHHLCSELTMGRAR